MKVGNRLLLAILCPTVHHVNSSWSSHEKDLRLDHTKNSGALGFLVHRKLIQLSYIKAFNFDSILIDFQRPFDWAQEKFHYYEEE